MSQYQSSFPDVPVKSEVKSFFEEFYKISDTPDAHEKYAEQFTNNAKLIMASNEVNGRPDILNLRKGMWEKVAKRSHKPIKIFPFGPNSDEVMLFGTVGYDLKDGKHADVDWAARAHTVQEDGATRMDFYQVYLDTAAMQRAK